MDLEIMTPIYSNVRVYDTCVATDDWVYDYDLDKCRNDSYSM